jgi:probable rRNA maturation factor
MRRWINAALPQNKNISLRIVDSEEIQALNLQYRNKDKPTNVLSFPCVLPDGVDDPLLGDIVICGPIIEQEASEYNIEVQAHWAHMLIHGTLHLLGYDHIEEADALAMEKLETNILTKLGFPEPYTQQDHRE